MADYQDRVKAERAELSGKLGNLNVFLAGLEDQGAPVIPSFDIGMLVAQSRVMTMYLEILDRRISRFKE